MDFRIICVNFFANQKSHLMSLLIRWRQEGSCFLGVET